MNFLVNLNVKLQFNYLTKNENDKINASKPPANLPQLPKYRHTTMKARQRNHLDYYKITFIFTLLETKL